MALNGDNVNNKVWISIASLVWCMSATAQSSVTVYGRADTGVVVQTNRSTGGTLRSVDTNVWNPSQLGFKGQEDLGDGLRAVFDMASTIRLDLGQTASTTKFWDRHAFVGLSDKRWGTLLLGRQVNLLTETLWVVDPLAARNSATNMSLRLGYLGGPGNTITNNFGPNPGVAGASLDRVDNAVKYTLRSESTGLLVSAMKGTNEGGAVGGGAAGMLIGYDGNGASLRGSYMQFKDAAGIAFNAYAAGAAYRTGSLTFKASYIENKINSALQTAAKPYGNLETKVGAVGVVWALPSGLDLNFAYYKGKRTQDNAAAQSAQKLYFVPEYKLSKRTSVVMVAVHETFNAAGAALDTGTPLLPGARSSNYLGTALTHVF